MCKRYRIDNSKREQHSALVDCDLLTKIYINLIDQKEPSLDFKRDDIFKEKRPVGNISFSKKVVNPTQEELEKHQEYIKTKFKKNYF